MGKRFKAEEIVMKLREVELAMNKGMDAAQACRQAVVSEQSYYRWSPGPCNVTQSLYSILFISLGKSNISRKG